MNTEAFLPVAVTRAPSVALEDLPARTRARQPGRLQRLIGGVTGVWWACAAALLGLWAGFAWMAARELSQVQDHQVTSVTLEARGLSEYVSLHLLLVDRLLLEVRESFETTGAMASSMHLAQELKESGPWVLGVGVADERGVIVQSTSRAAGMPAPDQFRRLAAAPGDRLLFTESGIDQATGTVSMQLLRPLRSPRGEFRGAVIASVDLQVLRLGAQDPLQEGATVNLLGREDAMVRIRLSQQAVTWGESVATGPTWKGISSLRSGVQRGVSVLDGVDRFIGFHQIGAYPLAVAVSVPAARWWDVGTGHLQLAFVMALALSVALVFAARARARLEAEQEENLRLLRDSRERELEANRMKSKFLASVSHELRTPLNSIVGFSELIRDESSDPQIARFAGLIHNSGRHLHGLVNTLLDLAKIEAGKMDVQLEQVAVGELLAAVVETHRVSAAAKGLALTLAIPDAPGVSLNTDRTRLVQVLNNVLHNAVKFTRSGAIAVTGGCSGDRFLIRVADSGIGISEPELGKVFERFNTVAAAAQQEAGSGLGLALCRDIMELLGGSISIRSEAGAGTQVDICLPMASRSAS